MCRDVDMDALARAVSVLKDETFVRCVLVELHSAKARLFWILDLPSINALPKCDVCRAGEGCSSRLHVISSSARWLRR